ncbi:MAG: GAF domain-containing protein [Rhodospirillaceae bacterium]|nr:GAF domain-containing protein [Rhodospirillaceae bacterium]
MASRSGPGTRAPDQQAVLAEFGKEAGTLTNVDELLSKACVMVAESLGVEYVKVLEWLPRENALIVRAGYGWGDDVVGQARVGADLESPAGYALRTSKPVIANDLREEKRFYTPKLLKDHKVIAAANVIIQSSRHIYGVFEADARKARAFTEKDTRFLQGAANLLALAIERHRLSEHNARLARQNEILLRELRHRAANNLQMIQNLIELQRADSKSPESLRALGKLAARVSALSIVTDQLASAGELERLDLSTYLTTLLGRLLSPAEIEGATIKLEAEFAHARVAVETSAYIGLIVNEFVQNAMKHAFNGSSEGRLTATLQKLDGAVTLTLADDGPGIPKDVFQQATNGGTGLGLIQLLIEQIHADAVWQTEKGTSLRLTLPEAETNETSPRQNPLAGEDRTFV